MKRAAFLTALLAGGCEPQVIDHLETCDCSDPADACRAGTCMQSEGSCTPTSGCDAPYLCDAETNRCACSPVPEEWVQCAPRCDEQTPCPSGTDCDSDSQLCMPPLQCIDDTVCAPGETCAEGHTFASIIWDGNSGYSRGTSVGKTCIPGSTSISDCTTSIDCDDEDCMLSFDGLVCGGRRLCDDDEFRVGETPALCYSHRPCRFDHDCPPARTCRVFDHEASGYCGRPA